MKPSDRYAWILEYLRSHRGGVDVCNRHFAESYAEATGARSHAQPYGAPYVPQLGRDLSAMKKGAMLRRGVVGLTNRESGFAPWVYVYNLSPSYEALLAAAPEMPSADQA